MAKLMVANVKPKELTRERLAEQFNDCFDGNRHQRAQAIHLILGHIAAVENERDILQEEISKIIQISTAMKTKPTIS